jgi:hypothetical protein
MRGFSGESPHSAVTFGVEYRLAPSISFELTYGKVDWGQGGAMTDDDSLIRLRTLVTF